MTKYSSPTKALTPWVLVPCRGQDLKIVQDLPTHIKSSQCCPYVLTICTSAACKPAHRDPPPRQIFAPTASKRKGSVFFFASTRAATLSHNASPQMEGRDNPPPPTRQPASKQRTRLSQPTSREPPVYRCQSIRPPFPAFPSCQGCELKYIVLSKAERDPTH